MNCIVIWKLESDLLKRPKLYTGLCHGDVHIPTHEVMNNSLTHYPSGAQTFVLSFPDELDIHSYVYSLERNWYRWIGSHGSDGNCTHYIQVDILESKVFIQC